MTPALEVTGLNKRFGGLPATREVSLTVMPGERRLIIGPNGAGKTTLFNLVTGDLTPDAGSVKLFGQELLQAADAAARASRARAHLPDPHAVPEGDALPQRRAGAARPRQAALESVDRIFPASAISTTPRAKRSRWSASAPARDRTVGGDLLRRTAPPRNGDGAGAEAEGAAARRAARGAFPGRAQPSARTARRACRATSPS